MEVFLSEVVAVVFIVMSLSVMAYLLNKIIQMQTDVAKTKTNQKEQPLKLVKLYSQSGDVLQTYENVYLSHWDTNIYHLYTHEDGEFIIRLDIGANMLLTSQNITNDVLTKEAP